MNFNLSLNKHYFLRCVDILIIMLVTEIFFIIIGLGLLIYGSNFFIESATKITDYFGIHPLITGIVIVGLATSAPEIVVGVVAALQGKTIVAVGNALGSNIANIGLVLGLIYLMFAATVKHISSEYKLMLATILLALILALDGSYGRLDGIILIMVLTTILTILVRRSLQAATYNIATNSNQLSLMKQFSILLLGLVLLLIGAKLLVEHAVIIAKDHLGVSDLVIGLTIVAVGTSLPELATSITSAVKKQFHIAIGNIIGSNMFNITIVLGVPVLIQPVDIDRVVVYRDFLVMIVMTILLGGMLFLFKKDIIARISGLLLFMLFCGYQLFLFCR